MLSYNVIIVFMQTRLPSRVLPDQMDRHGEMRIIIFPEANNGRYTRRQKKMDASS